MTKNEKMALGTLENPEMAPSCAIGIPKPPEEGSTLAHNVTASRTPRNAKEKKALRAMRRMSNLLNRRMSMIEEQREEDAEEEGEEEREEDEEEEVEVEIEDEEEVERLLFSMSS